MHANRSVFVMMPEHIASGVVLRSCPMRVQPALCLCLTMACVGGPPPTPATEESPSVEPAPEPVAPEPEPTPEPEPEPEIARLPDGTPIVACQTPPAGMACVPGGSFIRGTDDGPANTRPSATIWLQTFYMDIDEVTFEQYKACKQATQCPRGGPLYNDFSRPTQPITGVTWYGAVAFCEAQGKHLPTEAQWEKAARGPDGALYPWGDEPANCELAVIEDERGRSCGVKKLHEHPDKGRTFEVGSRPAGIYGLRDMIGNAWEWVYDWSSESWAECGADCEGIDPRGPCQGAETCAGVETKVVRGGSWYYDATYATGAYRRTHYPENEHSNFHHFGFRCAASPDEVKALLERPAAQ
jgi:sulfatase modifying factor 1